VLNLEGEGELGQLGLTELFFESVEPANGQRLFKFENISIGDDGHFSVITIIMVLIARPLFLVANLSQG
jgi:hypothetical protein